MAALVAQPCVVAAAHAYTTTGAYWTWQDHPIEDAFFISGESFPTSAGTAEEAVAAVEGAMAQWDALPLDLTLTSGGATSATDVDFDGHFVVSHGEYDMGSLGGTLAFAATWTYDDGGAFDCDVRFLPANDYGAIAWDATGSDRGYGIASTALHELGHCLGLDHSADAGAVMYAYYNNVTALTGDDVAGVGTLFGDTPCADGDGDGWTDCDADCDDNNALVHPGAGEVCDGADGDCDGVVDSTATTTVSMNGVTHADYDWPGALNVFRVDVPTRLVSLRQHAQAPEGTRLAWIVQVADSAEGPWTVARTEPAYATGEEWEESPRLDLPLEAGRWYAVGLGAMAMGTTAWFDSSPSFDAQGPLTPVGFVFATALGVGAAAPDTTYLWGQELTVLDLADPDQDGVTAECGDPCPDDAADTCDDPPPVEDTGDTAAPPTADTGDPPPIAEEAPPETPGGCGCGGGAAPGVLAIALVAAITSRRR